MLTLTQHEAELSHPNPRRFEGGLFNGLLLSACLSAWLSVRLPPLLPRCLATAPQLTTRHTQL